MSPLSGRHRTKPVDDQSARARHAMVADQLERRGVRDEDVLRAMDAVPREAFVAAADAHAAYDDRPLPIGAGQTISQPYIVARMTELLRVRPNDRILEIGTGSGYQAAILASLGARVTTIERNPALAEAARERLARLGFGAVVVRVGDGSLGSRDGAPWDGIVVTAGAPAVPQALREQLRIGGRLVIPVGERRAQELVSIERVAEADWRERSDGPVVFVPLLGEAGWAPDEG